MNWSMRNRQPAPSSGIGDSARTRIATSVPGQPVGGTPTNDRSSRRHRESSQAAPILALNDTPQRHNQLSRRRASTLRSAAAMSRFGAVSEAQVRSARYHHEINELRPRPSVITGSTERQAVARPRSETRAGPMGGPEG